MGAIPLGAGPDMVLSPDGHHLYIASGAQGHTDVINTETGKVESTFITNRLAQLGGAAFSSMIVSPNSRWLFVMEMTGGPPLPVNYALATYDTYHDNELVEKTAIPDCGVGRLAWVGEKLALHCYRSDSVTIFNVDAIGKTTRAKSPLALNRQTQKTANVFFLGDSEGAAVFTDSGAVTHVSLSSQEDVPKTVQLTSEHWVNAENWPQSSDGRTIYIATGPKEAKHTESSNEILIFDTILWSYTGAISTSVPFFSLTLNNDTGVLYAISASERKILIIDTAKRVEVGAITLPAAKPRIAIVAP